MSGKPLLVIALLLSVAGSASAQLPPTATFAAQLASQYQVASNVTYRTASNQQLKMDVYYRRGVTTPQPTLVYIHGGFWVAGAKETAILGLVPWMEMGWNVVNVEYRLGVATDVSTLAPAAVVDCFCALRFVAGSAAAYNVDVNRIVVTGESAGGHLALAMGMIPENAISSPADCAGAAAVAIAKPVPGRGRQPNQRPDRLKETRMKEVEKKDTPEVSGGDAEYGGIGGLGYPVMPLPVPVAEQRNPLIVPEDPLP